MAPQEVIRWRPPSITFQQSESPAGYAIAFKNHGDGTCFVQATHKTMDGQFEVMQHLGRVERIPGEVSDRENLALRKKAALQMKAACEAHALAQRAER